MVNLSLYRAAFAPALIAFVALMFSLQGIPEPLEPAVPPGSFEAGRAAATAREIVAAAPERTPGSEGDTAAAEIVAERFGEIPSGSVSEQSFEADFDGEGVEARNVILTLPGESPETLVVLAARDSAEGPGAASSAAATGVLTELAAALGVAGHSKTYVVASTSGAAEGAVGARELLTGLPATNVVEAVVVVSQPGPAEPSPPFVITTSTDTRRTAIQLERTATEAVEVQAGEAPPGDSGAFGQLARLAIPSGLGEQAPLIADGIDAVRISGAGERPLRPAEDGPENVSPITLGEFGRAAQSIVQAIEADTESLEHGPDAYVETGGNLVPGWTLALLGLTLLIPPAVAAIDAVARASRRSAEPASAVLWAASRGLPLLGGLLVLYALALVGIVPRPSFPFDPASQPVGVAAVATGLLCLGAIAAGAVAVSELSAPASPSSGVLAAGLGAVSTTAGLLIWLANPYLGLLAAPAAHVWLLAAGRPGRARITVAAVAAVVALLPLALAAGEVASALELGGDSVWMLALMLADGQIGFLSAVASCFLGGALVGTIAVTRAAAPEPAPGA